MDASEISQILSDIIEEAAWMEEDDLKYNGLEFLSDLSEAEVTSYEAGGYLTTDDGFVLKMKDGSEFQITVKRSR